VPPSLSDSIKFSDNSAAIDYGANIASYPAYLDLTMDGHTLYAKSGEPMSENISLGLFDQNG